MTTLFVTSSGAKNRTGNIDLSTTKDVDQASSCPGRKSIPSTIHVGRVDWDTFTFSAYCDRDQISCSPRKASSAEPSSEFANIADRVLLTKRQVTFTHVRPPPPRDRSGFSDESQLCCMT